MSYLVTVALFFLSVTVRQSLEAGIFETLGIGTLQSAGVRGVLMCEGKPAANIKVKLYDVDTADPDDLLDQAVTNNDGEFELKGHETEVSTIDPKLNIYHHCNDHGILNELCYRKFSIVIPKNYVNEGAVPKKVFDIGTLNLEGSYSGESRDCLN